MSGFYKYNGEVWYYNPVTRMLQQGDGVRCKQLRIDQWDDGLPKIGTEYGIPCNHMGSTATVKKQPDEVAGAKKYDSDKPMVDLLFDGCPQALLALSEVLTYGFKKYGGKHGWKSLPDAVKRYESAMLRHQLALASGEVNDPESGLPHAAHIACNALFLLQFHKEPKKCS